MKLDVFVNIFDCKLKLNLKNGLTMFGVILFSTTSHVNLKFFFFFSFDLSTLKSHKNHKTQNEKLLLRHQWFFVSI